MRRLMIAYIILTLLLGVSYAYLKSQEVIERRCFLHDREVPCPTRYSYLPPTPENFTLPFTIKNQS
jgi:hypothetical protein